MCLYITINPNLWRASLQKPRSEPGFRWSPHLFKHDERDDCGGCEQSCDDYHHDSNRDVLVEPSKGRNPTAMEQENEIREMS